MTAVNFVYTPDQACIVTDSLISGPRPQHASKVLALPHIRSVIAFTGAFLVFADLAAVLLAADVRDGKVSFEGARDDYGVVLTGPQDDPVVDKEATEALRAELRSLGAAAFFDRGPGYPLLSGGRLLAEVDTL